MASKNSRQVLSYDARRQHRAGDFESVQQREVRGRDIDVYVQRVAGPGGGHAAEFKINGQTLSSGSGASLRDAIQRAASHAGFTLAKHTGGVRFHLLALPHTLAAEPEIVAAIKEEMGNDAV